MKEALDFLIGKTVIVYGYKSMGATLFSGNVDGTYIWLNGKFSHTDVREIRVTKTHIFLYLRDRLK